MKPHRRWQKRLDRRAMLRIAAAGSLGTTGLAGRATAAESGPKSGVLEAYADRLSCQPGEQVRLHVSTTAANYAIEIARIGAKREVVWSKAEVPGAFHATPANVSTHGCRWPATLAVPISEGWRSGYYAVTLRAKGASGPLQGEAFFVVRAARPGLGSKVLLQLTTNTWNAYSNWGGPCLYEGGPLPMHGARVSFERPMARGFLTKPDGKLSYWHPFAGWQNWELPFVQWAESAGYALDYAVNSDLEFRPEMLSKYRLVLSVGHDEYWSAPMRDHLEAYIAGGGNVAFFSGNVCFWQVRSEDDGRAIVSYKYRYQQDPYYKRGEHKLMTGVWSHHLIGRPENQLTGVSFLRGGYHRFGSVPRGEGGYTIHRPKHWVFDGTGLLWGDVLGAKDKVVGYECDGCEFQFEKGLPIPTGRDGTPKGFEMLATAPAKLWDHEIELFSRCVFGDKTTERLDRGAAVMGIYTKGGTVFTTGCTEWVRGLQGRDPLVERITKNVLDRLS